MLTLPTTLTHSVAAKFALGVQQAVLSQPSDVVADASALQEFDSSALSVLLESRRQALAAGKSFSVQGVPPRLLQLAKLYGVSELISDKT